MKRKHEFQVIIEQDEAGYYVAECPALRACYSQGQTYEEAFANIKDVIAMCLDDIKDPAEAAAFRAELERRSEEMTSGKVKGNPGDEVMGRLWAKYP